MPWCFSTRASVATVLTTHPCVFRCLRVNCNFVLICPPPQAIIIICQQFWPPFFEWASNNSRCFNNSFVSDINVMFHIKQFSYITTHLLTNECADWPKLHDMFKACDAKTWQREFPVGSPARVCALNLLLINIFHDVVACIESRCMIKAKHVLLVC